MSEEIPLDGTAEKILLTRLNNLKVSIIYFTSLYLLVDSYLVSLRTRNAEYILCVSVCTIAQREKKIRDSEKESEYESSLKRHPPAFMFSENIYLLLCTYSFVENNNVSRSLLLLCDSKNRRFLRFRFQEDLFLIELSSEHARSRARHTTRDDPSKPAGHAYIHT